MPQMSSLRGLPPLITLEKFETALKDHQFDEVWEAYTYSQLDLVQETLKNSQLEAAREAHNDNKRPYLFPAEIVMDRLVADLICSSDSKLLCRLVSLFYRFRIILTADMMSKLALSLAKAQLPVSAVSILRVMFKRGGLRTLDFLHLVFLSLVKTDIGTYVASNVLFELYDRLHNFSSRKYSAEHTEMTDNTTIFNIVLDACVEFELPLKGQQIIEMMEQSRLVGDAHTALAVAWILEKNGMRDELMKFKDYIDAVPVNLIGHYRQFYECLLSLHFKFNDIDATSALLLDICGLFKPKPSEMCQRELPEICCVSIGSKNRREGLELKLLPEKLQKDSVYGSESKQELLMHKNGKFVLSNKGLAKLIVGYKKRKRINELSKLLINISGYVEQK